MSPTSSPKVTTGWKAKPKKSKGAAPNLEALEQAKASGKAQFSWAKNTCNAYNAYVSCGKDFLAKLVMDRRHSEPVKCSEEGAGGDGINLDELEKAFNETGPNWYLVDALEYFITQKCFTEGQGLSTALQIHAAFADY